MVNNLFKTIQELKVYVSRRTPLNFPQIMELVVLVLVVVIAIISTAMYALEGHFVQLRVPQGSGSLAFKVEATPYVKGISLLSECNPLQFGGKTHIAFAPGGLSIIEVHNPCSVGGQLSSTGLLGGALSGIVVKVSQCNVDLVIADGNGTMGVSNGGSRD